jgi:hypothetical protein
MSAKAQHVASTLSTRYLVSLVATTWVGATVVVALEAWVFNHLFVSSTFGFTAVLLSVFVGSFLVFYRHLSRGPIPRGQRLLRGLGCFGLALATYFVAINTAFALATYLFGP